MAQRLSTDFINTNIPGAYVKTTAISNPVGLASSGIVVIMGEADGGPSYSQVVLKNNTFTPDQLDKVTQMYISGPIVDAFRALSAPSNDSDIVGSANLVYIIKTNTSVKASAAVNTNYGTFSDKNYGLPGNSYKFQVTSTASEVAPTLSGSTIPAFGAALNGASFSVRQNGGASSTVTLSATSADHANIGALITELNALLPTGLTASAGTASNSLKLTTAVDSAAFHSGSGKSFELIDSGSDLTAFGLSAGIQVSSQEPAVEVQISNATSGTNETIDASADVSLLVGYAGTTATLSISGHTLSTTVTGGSGANLSVDMSQFNTVKDLASFIGSQPGYTASASAAAQQSPTSSLDKVSAIGIASTAASQTPGRIKSAAFNFAQAMSTSHSVNFAPTAVAGLPAPSANSAFLSGGAKGGTASIDIVNAVAQLAGIQCNIIVPLFSQDATADIALGLTDSTSAYTIDSIHALLKNHCIAYSTPKLKRNRIAILSYWGTYASAKSKAQGLGNYRVSFTFQKCSQVNSSGNSQSFMPWYGAVVAAGMQAGGFYKSITNKLANVISFQDPSGFDSGSPGDVEDALDAGMLMLNKVTSGNRWVSDQTTYGYDTNFVYNSIQAVYLSDILALDLGQSFQDAFVGKSLADVDAATALSFLAQKMDGYKKLKMIASSDDAPLGYKNAKVSISAPEMDVAVEIKLATAIYFIPISLSLSQVQQSA